MEFITKFDQTLSVQNLDFVPPTWLDYLLRNATYLGDSRLMILLIPLLGLYLQRTNGWRTALIFVLGTSAACLTCETLKHCVGRNRPEVTQMRLEGIKVPTSPSFPSGHTFSASALYPGLAFIMARFSSSPAPQSRPAFIRYRSSPLSWLYQALSGGSFLLRCNRWPSWRIHFCFSNGFLYS